MFFPLRDDNPTLQTPYITYGLILMNIVVWLTLQGYGSQPALAQSVCQLGMIPGELTGQLPGRVQIPVAPGLACVVGGDPNVYTVLYAMFMHGGWFHLLGNMWFLAIFGNNVEDAMGRWRFVVFYLLCGLAAALAQILVNPSSPIPMVGASGAIGGVMGAYIVLYPRVPIHSVVFLGIIFFRVVVPAFVMLGFWFAVQLVSALPTVGNALGGVAFWAHVGGFLAGVGLIYLFRDPRRVAAHQTLVMRELWRRY